MKIFVRSSVCMIIAAFLLSAAMPGFAARPAGSAGDPDLQPRGASAQASTALVPAGLSMQAPSAQAQAPLALGKPGLSYRYAQEWGVRSIAYLQDSAYLNYPTGVFATANGVWVMEERGMRALQFSTNGVFQQKIGNAGLRYLYIPELGRTLSLENLSDAAVDADGNLWLVDSSPSIVLEFGPDGTYKNMIGIEYTSDGSNSTFQYPSGIAFDSQGHIYVSDANIHRVQVFDKDRNYLATIGESGVSGDDNSHFNRPIRLAVDTQDLLYVADADNQRVQVFNVSDTTNITYVTTLGTTGEIGDDAAHFCYPQGVGVDAAHVYVADNCNQRVQIFDINVDTSTDPDTYTYPYTATLGLTGDRGTDNTRLDSPMDVSVDPTGNIFVADYRNQRVQVFNSSRQYLRSIGHTSVPYQTDAAHFNRPSSVAVDNARNMYVLEQAGQRLTKMDSTGKVVWTIGTPGVFAWDWEDPNHQGLDDPQDLALAPNGNIYVSNGNGDVRIYGPNGAYVSSIGTGWGQADTEYNGNTGLFVAADGKLYVADRGNQRVEIFNADGSYRARLGVTGVCNTDNSHFCSPRDVVVDAAGNIYVADTDNQRVQVYNSSLQYVRTLGVTGVARDDYGYFSGPSYLALDASGNLYVASTWNSTVYAFDPQGKFLGGWGGWGGYDSNLSNVSGIAFGPDGSLYLADYDYARVARFAPGYPGWQQANITGFGQRSSTSPVGMVTYKNHLYTSVGGTSGVIKSLDTTGAWSDINLAWGGAGQSITSLYVYNDKLYVSAWTGDTNGACTGLSLKSFDGTTWTDLVSGGFGGDTSLCEMDYMAGLNNDLYGVVWSSSGTQLWRSASSSGSAWNKVADLTMIDANAYAQALIAYNGALYLAEYGDDGGYESGRIWSSPDGVTWTAATADGFGNAKTGYGPIALSVYKGYLYAGVRNYEDAGAQLWRCQACTTQAGWQNVADHGFDNVDADQNGTVDNYRIESFAEKDGLLYAAVGNTTTGAQVWYTMNGTQWYRIAANGFGVGDTRAAYGLNGAAFNGQVYFGLTNYNLGAQVWAFTGFKTYIPTIRR